MLSFTEWFSLHYALGELSAGLGLNPLDMTQVSACDLFVLCANWTGKGKGQKHETFFSFSSSANIFVSSIQALKFCRKEL